MMKSANLELLLLVWLATSVQGAPSTQLTAYRPADKVIESITKTVQEEVHFNVVNAYLGLFPEVSAASCKVIAENKPDYKSGYYWITGPAGPVGVYCEMDSPFEQKGGWMRIANMDTRKTHSQCPNGLHFIEIHNKNTCQGLEITPGCTSTVFSVHDVSYKKVCGKVIGYQKRRPNGFGPARSTPYINTSYVDGVSITHGVPRQHIWTMAAATGEGTHVAHATCPCMNFSRTFVGVIPEFVGNDYFCETGNRNDRELQFFPDDPLWDGKGCKGVNMCCDRGGPWFCKELFDSTNESIEVRVCRNQEKSSEDTPLEQIEIYVQ